MKEMHCAKLPKREIDLYMVTLRQILTIQRSSPSWRFSLPSLKKYSLNHIRSVPLRGRSRTSLMRWTRQRQAREGGGRRQADGQGAARERRGERFKTPPALPAAAKSR